MRIIILATNIDAYSASDFPELDFIPSKGDFIYVRAKRYEHFIKKGLPLRLEVISINHYEVTTVIELYFNETDRKLYLLKKT
jgi:hypothetical protein